MGQVLYTKHIRRRRSSRILQDGNTNDHSDTQEQTAQRVNLKAPRDLHRYTGNRRSWESQYNRTERFAPCIVPQKTHHGQMEQKQRSQRRYSSRCRGNWRAKSQIINGRGKSRIVESQRRKGKQPLQMLNACPIALPMYNG